MTSSKENVTESIYGSMATPNSPNDLIKTQMTELYKLLETSLVDVEKPAGLRNFKVICRDFFCRVE